MLLRYLLHKFHFHFSALGEHPAVDLINISEFLTEILQLCQIKNMFYAKNVSRGTKKGKIYSQKRRKKAEETHSRTTHHQRERNAANGAFEKALNSKKGNTQLQNYCSLRCDLRSCHCVLVAESRF